MADLLLVKNIRYLISCAGDTPVQENVNLLCCDGVIAYIGPEEKEADHVLDGSHLAVYPGLINTHHHLYQLFSRNLAAVQNMELFDWLRALYRIWAGLNEQVIYHSTLMGAAELLRSGCTTCQDHHYVFPKGSGRGLTDAQFAAAATAGIRFHACRGSMDLSEKDGGLPPDSVAQSIDEILEDCERVANQYHDSAPFAMRRVVFAPCSPFSVTGDLMRQSAILARCMGVNLHTHLGETRDETAFTLERFGMRPLEYARSLGWTGPDVSFAHGIHFNDEELEVLRDTGTCVAHCPISNMKLASGVARVPDFLRMGIPVGLAVDGSASNDGSSMLEELRVGYLLHRLHASKDAPDGRAMLRIATNGGAKLLGRDDIGSLAVGKAADFFAIDLRRPEADALRFDPEAFLCTVGFKGAVDYTVVNGEIVVKEGHCTRFDDMRAAENAARVESRYLGFPVEAPRGFDDTKKI